MFINVLSDDVISIRYFLKDRMRDIAEYNKVEYDEDKIESICDMLANICASAIERELMKA